MHHPPSDPQQTMDWTILRRLLPFVSAWRGRASFALLLLLLAKVATVAVPLVLKGIVDGLDASVHGQLILPLGLLLGYGALRLAATLFRELQATLFADVRLGIMRQISRRVLSHLHRLSLRFHLTRKTGAVARDINRGTSSVSSLLSYLLFNVMPTLVELGLVSAILLATYNVWFMLITVLTVVAYAAFTLLVTRWRLKFRVEMNTLDSRASSQAIDSLLNFETVKSFGNENFEVERYDESLAAWQKVAVRSRSSLSVLNVGQGALIAIGVTLTMILAGEEVVAGQMSIGDLVAVNAFLLQLFLPLGFLGTIYSMVRNALTDMSRMFQLLDIKPEIVDRPKARELVVARGEVVFDNVSFAYDPKRPILDRVSFRIPPGHKVAVVGRSGAGKSTLARLLFRFYDASDGRILIDDQDISEVRQHSLRQAIGIVPQDTVLFNETIRYNIEYGRLEAKENQLIDALGMAQLDDFIASLPDGLESRVGERGLKLSGGEKQRVAIARAILKNPPLLIFDEATSSLDSHAEQAILQALALVARNHTTLVIAHRLSTVVDADEILVLDDGQLVEQGTHPELLKRGGYYAEMWRLQQKEAQQGDRSE